MHIMFQNLHHNTKNVKTKRQNFKLYCITHLRVNECRQARESSIEGEQGKKGCMIALQANGTPIIIPRTATYVARRGSS